jgi:hypothetical protein
MIRIVPSIDASENDPAGVFAPASSAWEMAAKS